MCWQIVPTCSKKTNTLKIPLIRVENLNASSVNSLLVLLVLERLCLASILAALHQPVIGSPESLLRKLTSRHPMVHVCTTVVNKHEAAKIGRTPNQLEGNA